MFDHCFSSGYRIPDTALELLLEDCVWLSHQADVTEQAASVACAAIREVKVEVPLFPLNHHAAKISDELLMPLLDLPGVTVGDSLGGIVLRLED